jgi:hypothetical protein
VIAVSCYFRRIRDVFEAAGIEITPQNKKDIDRAIHKIAGVKYKDCPATWKRLNQQFLADEKSRKILVKKISSALR